MRSISLFFIIFHTLYLLMNFYVFRRLLGCFGVTRPWIIWPLVLVCTFSLFAATLAYYRFGAAVYPLYYIATLWFGVVWLFFCCLIVCEPLRIFARGINPAHIGSAVVAIVAITTLYAAIHATSFRVVHHEIPAPVNLRLVQLSDLHLGSVRPGYARKVVAAVNSLKPDAVLITGDIIDSVHPLSTDGLEAFKGLTAPAFCVTGNHEHYAGFERSVATLQAAGFTVLRGESVTFKGVRFVGLDDDSRPSALAERLPAVNIDPAEFNILLYHRPEGFSDAAAAGIRLMLAGHTHHGQVFPFSLLIRLRFEYPYGLYHHGQATLYTTQGTGTWGPRMRLGTTSEIVVLDLRKTAAQE
jgi:predicted MPP superfamily phosphohydrolase